MKRDILAKALKSAVWIALPCALIGLLGCTLMLGSGAFEMLLPLWLFLIFTGISCALARIPFFAGRLWAKIAVSAVLVSAAALCLHFL